MKISASILLSAAIRVFAGRGDDDRHHHHRGDLEVEAGYHIIYSYPELTPPDSLFELISAGKVGGIALSPGNVDENLPSVLEKFQRAYKHAPGSFGQPLPIMIDQEGGPARGLPGPPEKSQRQVGMEADPAGAAAEQGRLAAQTVKEWSVNVNIAPVLAVPRGADTLLYERSYSEDPEIVGACAAASIQAQDKEGIIPVAKHFPGFGAAGVDDDTWFGPVVLDIPLDELRSVDMLPYRRAISNSDLDVIMVNWATYPAVDAEKPAGLSKAMVQGELRSRLGFRGVTLSETLPAGALESFGDLGRRAVLASQAGMDLILVAYANVTQAEEVHGAVVKALDQGELDRRDFGAATRRILRLKKKLGEYC